MFITQSKKEKVRVIKLSYRRGDAAPLSAIELVGLDVPFKPVEDEASDLEKDQPEES